LLAGLDLDAASTLHAVVMSIDIQMTTEQVRGSTPALLEMDYGGMDAVFADTCGNLLNLHQD